MKLVTFVEIVSRAHNGDDRDYLGKRAYFQARSDIQDRILGGLCDNDWFYTHDIDACAAESGGKPLSDQTLMDFFTDIGYIRFDESGHLWERWSD